MRLELYIAGRYFFARKRNIINVITLISVAGVAVGAMALVVVLSVFNGFDGLIRSLFGTFDPDLKVELAEGKSFARPDSVCAALQALEGVELAAAVYEDNALARYVDKTHPVVAKGVPPEWWRMSGVDTMLVDGVARPARDPDAYCAVGAELAYKLGLGLRFIQPMWFYAPRRAAGRELRADNAFAQDHIFATGIFSIQADIDSRYAILPLDYVRRLFDAGPTATAVEVKLRPGARPAQVARQAQAALGGRFTVKDRHRQHEFLFRVMESEKWIIFAILAFIMVVASLSVIGSLMMLVMDKRDDARTLRVLGMELAAVRRVFVAQGLLISLCGSLAGVALGAAVCWAQETFALVRFDVGGNMVVDAYPVRMLGSDIALIFAVVVAISFATSYYPVRVATRRFFGGQAAG